MQPREIDQKAGDIWQRFASKSLPGSLELELIFYKKLLGYLQAGSSYYFTFNHSGATFEMISPEIEQVLGYPVNEISMGKVLKGIHPEDLPYFFSFESKVVDFFLQLPKEKITRYKARYDLRIQRKDGVYIRLLHQALVTNHDEEGKIGRMFCLHSDISYLKQEGRPILSFIGLEGEPSYLDIGAAGSEIKIQLTRREEEILKFFASGKTSKEVAYELGVSKPTVDTHRRNMLKKNRVASTSELVGKAIRNGWI